MGCPFLKETRTRNCHAMPARRGIVCEATAAATDKCLTAAHATCPVLVERKVSPSPTGRCPLLDETLVQYCAAAQTPKYIPFSQSQITRCGSSAYRYCEMYLSLARPSLDRPDTVQNIDGIDLPERLFFTPNHLWLDVEEDGMCHIGVDALLASVLAQVDRVHFITVRGTCRPSAVISAHGVDWPLTFPKPVLLERPNLYLRADPGRLLRDPYRTGWLFEGWELPAENGQDSSLMRGARAAAWMRAEVQRLNERVHRLAGTRHAGVFALAGDGGSLAPGFASALSRDEVLEVLHEFFSPQRGWMQES